ncbi:MAG: M24 family metallopeptidase [Acidobacteriota bacterium]
MTGSAAPGSAATGSAATGSRAASSGGGGDLLSAVRRLLGEQGSSALLLVTSSSRDADLAPFVGPAHLGESLLLVTAAKAWLACFSPMEREEAASTGLDLLSPDDLEIARHARESTEPEDFLARVIGSAFAVAKLTPGTIALAGHGAAGPVHAAARALEAQGWRFVPGNELVRRARKRKGLAEVAVIRWAADATSAALRRVAERLNAAGAQRGELWLGGERLRVGRLREEIARVLAERGLEQPEGNIVACGGAGGVPHNQGDSEHVVRVGESIVVDLFPQRRLFADCTRTFCVGDAPEALAKAHAAVLAVLREAHAGALAGVRGFALQERACASLAAAGYPTPLTHPGTLVGYVHGLGHGVGHELHELPSFRKESGPEGVLEVGDVITLEPGLYDPEAYGVRLEDLCWLGPQGLENLTPLPYDLDPKVWVAR